MEEIKQVIKRSGITSFIILVYGVIINEKIVYLGMFLGSLVSILCFYMLYIDASTNIIKGAGTRGAVVGYLKRYAIYMFVLAGAVYLFGLPMLLSTAVGLLNIKFNIILLVLYKNILKIKNNV